MNPCMERGSLSDGEIEEDEMIHPEVLTLGDV